VYSRASPGDHHHHVGPEEEYDQGPSDGNDGCGGVLLCGVQPGAKLNSEVNSIQKIPI
jgi:hypothetical protein